MSIATAPDEARTLPDRLVPRVEVARLFGVTEQTVRSWEAAGQIPKSVKVGRRSYWRPDQIARFLGTRPDTSEG